MLVKGATDGWYLSMHYLGLIYLDKYANGFNIAHEEQAVLVCGA